MNGENTSRFSSWTRLLVFLFHSVVFLPLLLTICAGIAMGVHPFRLFLFSIFTLTAISLEICWNCIVQAVQSITRLGKLARTAYEHRLDVAPKIVGVLEEAKFWTAVYVLLTFCTLVGWTFVAVCELKHMSSGPETHSMDEAHSTWAESIWATLTSSPDGIPFWLIATATVFSTINFGLALRKLWLHSLSKDDQIVDEFINELILRGVPERVFLERELRT